MAYLIIHLKNLNWFVFTFNDNDIHLSGKRNIDLASHVNDAKRQYISGSFQKETIKKWCQPPRERVVNPGWAHVRVAKEPPCLQGDVQPTNTWIKITVPRMKACNYKKTSW